MEPLFRILDNYFSRECTTSIECITLKTANNHGCTVLIAYLLKRKINFLLTSDKNEELPPEFSDFILQAGSVAQDEEQFIAGLSLTKNPAYTPGPEKQKNSTGCIYFKSSGTTGAPKFICYTMNSITANARNCTDFFAFTNRTKILISVPVCHMYGFGVGLLPALLCGAAIHLIDQANVLKLHEAIASFAPDYVLITPSLIRMMLAIKIQQPLQCTFITAGERVTGSECNAFRERFGKLINLYGSSEMGAMAASAAVRSSASSDTPDLLRSIPGVSISITQKPKGEILCRNLAGFSCYVDSKGNQTGSSSTDGWYHTNDTAEWFNDNSFRITGRSDNFCNLSGFLTPVTEIESKVSKALPETTRVIIIVSAEHPEDRMRLTAVCETTPERAAALTASSAIKRCRKEMPSYMIPGHFYFLSSLPLLENGKTDMNLLRKKYSH